MECSETTRDDEILQSNVQIRTMCANSSSDTDEDDLSLQLKHIIRQSQKNRDLWEKSKSLPS